MSAAEVEAALAELEDLVRKGRRPGPHVARRVLLALGRGLRDGDPLIQGWLSRARSAGTALGAGWARSVQSELTMASGEFVQCVDPRYLALPAYDLDYTRAARGRLSDRLKAAAELGFGLGGDEARVLELADQVLATFERRSGSPGSLPTAPDGLSDAPQTRPRKGP